MNKLKVTIFLDLKKAFDTITQVLILSKLNSYKINRKLFAVVHGMTVHDCAL